MEAAMEDLAYQRYFLQPLDVRQRRYELLRTVFVDGQSLLDAAQHFDVSYGTVRNWVSEFRQQCDAGKRPPFSQIRLVVDRRTPQTITTRTSPLPISKLCPWSRDEG
jgi:transposase-like protein